MNKSLERDETFWDITEEIRHEIIKRKFRRILEEITDEFCRIPRPRPVKICVRISRRIPWRCVLELTCKTIHWGFPEDFSEEIYEKKHLKESLETFLNETIEGPMKKSRIFIEIGKRITAGITWCSKMKHFGPFFL